MACRMMELKAVPLYAHLLVHEHVSLCLQTCVCFQPSYSGPTELPTYPPVCPAPLATLRTTLSDTNGSYGYESERFHIELYVPRSNRSQVTNIIFVDTCTKIGSTLVDVIGT